MGEDKETGEGQDSDFFEQMLNEEDGFSAKKPKKEEQHVKTTQSHDEETDITKPKKKKFKEAPLKEGLEKVPLDEETDMVRPKLQPKKREELPDHLELSEDNETQIIKPKAKSVKLAKERMVSESEFLEEDSDLDREQGLEEESISEDFDEELFDLEGKDPEEVKRLLMEKARKESVLDSAPANVPLQFLEDSALDAVFIGRKKSVYQKYGTEAALLVGRIGEQEKENKNVLLDSLNPHVVFVCGARGSGKSYVLGVIAEELSLKNKQVGVVVVDPVGVFWSMKYPNREDKEIDALTQWKLQPQGLKNLKVFIPEGSKKEAPPNTFDETFSMQPSLLTSEDWCLTFGIERFSPTGLLLEKAMKKVEHGYKNLEGKYVKSKEKSYSLDDLISCLETDGELNSREKGYKQDSVRALVSRFEAAKGWGIFDEKGTPLSKISREGQLTVIDTSFLDDNVTALVIGILARRLLAARKITTRKEAAKKFKDLDVKQLLELEIPPTWLFIDEAHTLIPSGNVKTPASNALVEYVKQGRRPGLSLVFATQQPSAIDTRVLSQLDVIMSHKLIFDDDIKAIYKRTPTIIPLKYRRPTFLKTLPIGVALTGDRTEETSRAFIMRVRPRMSQHEGREAETVPSSEEMDPSQAKKIAVSMIWNDLEKESALDLKTAEQVVETLSSKYNASIPFSEVLDELEKKGAIIDGSGKSMSMPQPKAVIKAKTIAENIEESAQLLEEVEEQSFENQRQSSELISLPSKVTDQQAKEFFNRVRKKKSLGLFGSEETIQSIRLKYRTIWKVQFHEFNAKNEFLGNECFIDGSSGEFIHAKGNELIESKGVGKLYDLTDEETQALMALVQRKPLEENPRFKKLLNELVEKNIVRSQTDGKKVSYFLKHEFDLPPKATHPLLSSLNRLAFVKANSAELDRPIVSKEKAITMLKALWPNVLVKKLDALYWPIFEGTLQTPDGTKRKIQLDAYSGKALV